MSPEFHQRQNDRRSKRRSTMFACTSPRPGCERTVVTIWRRLLQAQWPFQNWWRKTARRRQSHSVGHMRSKGHARRASRARRTTQMLRQMEMTLPGALRNVHACIRYERVGIMRLHSACRQSSCGDCGGVHSTVRWMSLNGPLSASQVMIVNVTETGRRGVWKRSVDCTGKEGLVVMCKVYVPCESPVINYELPVMEIMRGGASGKCHVTNASVIARNMTSNPSFKLLCR